MKIFQNIFLITALLASAPHASANEGPTLSGSQQLGLVGGMIGMVVGLGIYDKIEKKGYVDHKNSILLPLGSIMALSAGTSFVFLKVLNMALDKLNQINNTEFQINSTESMQASMLTIAANITGTAILILGISTLHD